MARPTKLTDELQEAICQRVSNSESPAAAAQACGIAESTHYDWMKRGSLGDSPYSEYSEAIKKAQAEAESSHVANIQKAGADGKWQASAWWLERTMPEKYGKREVSIQEALAVFLKAATKGDEEVLRALRTIVQQAAQVPSA